MIEVFIFSLALCLQIVAVAVALRLARTTNKSGAWLLVATALVAMIAQHLLALQFSSASSLQLSSSIVSLIYGISILVGILLIRPIFGDLHESGRNLQKSEDTYQRIIDNLDDVFFRQDNDGKILLASPSVTQVLGYSVDELLGTRVTDLYTDPAIADYFRDEILANGRIENYELQLKRKDGGIVYTEINAVSMLDEKGSIVGAEGIFRDVTEQRQNEQSLAQAQKMEAVGQLTGGIAHDFNNLLTVILGNLELALLDEEEGTPLYDTLAQAVRAGESGAALTRRLLAFSRKQALQPEIVNLSELIINLDDMLSRTLGGDIDVQISGTKDIWLCEADPAQVESMILNLSINARDAMSGGGSLEITTGQKHVSVEDSARQPGLRAGDYALIIVKDNGHGMDAETADRIFEPFYTTKDQGRGSGLGLSMVYGFVKQSGGYISVESERDRGTTFTIYLPRTKKAGTDSRLAPDAFGTADGSSTCVLIVEDDPGLGQLVVHQLEQLGHLAYHAEDAVTALAILEENTGIDLLLIDVVLKGTVNGVELARQSLSLRPDLKILYMSGYSEDVLVNGGKIGTDVNLLEKPFNKVQLGEAIMVTIQD